MDYVVFGIGFGATVLVLGLLVRDIGPRLRYRKPADPDGVFHAEELVAKVSWSRFCGALGSVFALAGAIFLVITFVCMALTVSDGTARWVMGVSLLVLVLLVALWTWMFFDRFGSFGILLERNDEPEPVAAPEATATEPAGRATVAAPATHDTTVAVSGPRRPVDDQPATGEHPVDDVDDEPADVIDEPVAADEDDDFGNRTESPAGEIDDQPERRQTPEERLANAEPPLDHGSAEGELDIPASGSHRPPHRHRAAQARADAEDSPASEGDEGTHTNPSSEESADPPESSQNEDT